jgi:hypothetical protein
VDINGGAVELSWSFQTFQGDFIQEPCIGANVAQVQLRWEAGPGNSSAPGDTSFPCPAFHGITDFDIPEGPQMLQIAPVCVGGEVAAVRSYEVPEPIRRDVYHGEVVTLDSLLIVIDDTSIPGCACCDAAAGLQDSVPKLEHDIL